MVVLTGDTHGRFERIEAFCAEFGLTERDVLVILGDAGINYWLNERDKALKEGEAYHDQGFDRLGSGRTALHCGGGAHPAPL